MTPTEPDDPTTQQPPAAEPADPGAGGPPWARRPGIPGAGSRNPAPPAPGAPPAAPGPEAGPSGWPQQPSDSPAAPGSAAPVAPGAGGYNSGFPTGPAAYGPSFVPGAAGGQPPTAFVPPTPEQSAASLGRSHIRHTARGTSPLWYMLAAVGTYLLVFVILVVAVGSVEWDGTSSDGEAAAAGLGLLALLMMLVVAVLLFLWIRQIGVNAGQFGGGLVFLAWFPWEVLPFIGTGSSTSLSSMQVRAVVAVFCSVGAFLAFRRPLILGVWRAGHLPAPVIAQVLWIVAMASSFLFYAGTAAAYLNADERTTAFYRSYTTDPNEAVMAAGFILALVAGLAWFVTLLTVTIVQHVDIGNARRTLRQREY